VDSSQLKVDRPKGTSHPRYPELIYPLDYGYLEGTLSADELGWMSGWEPPEIVTYGGIILTVDLLNGTQK